MKCERDKELFERRGVTDAVLRLTLPAVFGQVILVLYNLADTFFVGMCGDVALLAAVTVCMPAFMFLSAISGLFGIGGASAIARALGENRRDLAKASAALSFWGCLGLTLCYSAGVWFLRHLFTDLLGGTDPAVHRHAVTYLVITVAIGGTTNTTGVMLSHLIRAEGHSLQAGAGIALGGVSNILLDPLFMFVLLPPGSEAMGAAIATALSGLISLLYYLVVLFRIRRTTVLSFRPGRRMFCGGVPGYVLKSGFPACMMTLAENVSYAILDKLMSLHGLEMQAGVGVAKKVNMLAHCIVRGIAQGSLPLLAYNFSARNMRRLRDSVKVIRRLAVGTALVCALISFIWSRPLVDIFLPNNETALHSGALFLRILCIGGPFSAGAYSAVSFFQATGEGGRSFLIAMLRKGLVDIPLMFLLSGLLPAWGIVAVTPATDAFCFLISRLLLTAYMHRLPMGTAAPEKLF